MGQEGGGEIGLVVLRDGHEEIAAIHPRRLEDGQVCAVALDDRDIELPFDLGGASGVTFDHDDVVTLPGERLAEVEAHLSGTHDDEMLLLQISTLRAYSLPIEGPPRRSRQLLLSPRQTPRGRK